MNPRYVCLGTLLAAAVGCATVVAQSAMLKPDILLIMPDQMRGDCLSCLDHAVVRTPHMDALAKEGALFRRAYSTVPSCIPARFALLTGLAPQTSGVVGYAMKPITTPTLPECLGRSGYVTVLVGRNMHQDPRSYSCGYQRQVLGSTYVADDDYDRELKQQEPASGGIQQLVARLQLDLNLWPAKAWPLAEELHPTAWVVRKSREAIAQCPDTQPLFLTASFYAPHPPLFPPARYFDINLKKNLPAPAFGDWVDRSALSKTGDKTGHRVWLEGDPLHRAQAGYFGLIEQLDDTIGTLIADFKVRSEKAGRPWVIVLTSDHGEMLGDHGFFRKCEPYEGSANIPLLMAGSPALGFKPGFRSVEPVCLEDLMLTLLELGGAKLPDQLSGVSLVPLLRGVAVHTRPWLHFEHAPCYSQEQSFHALTDGHIKYIWRPQTGREQLFDLDKDPREEHDLTLHAAHSPALEQWRARLVDRLAGRPEGFSDGHRLITGRSYPPLHPKGP
jgi:arylsulfatase